MGRSAFCVMRHKTGSSCDILDRTKNTHRKLWVPKIKIIGEKLVEINLQAVYMKAWGKSLHTKNQLPFSELSSGGLVPCDNYIIPCPYVLRMKVLC